MKKRLIICLLFGLLSISLLTNISAENPDFTDVYFSLCADASCNDGRVLFELGDSPIFIQAYNHEGMILSGEIIFPDGTTQELNFNHLFLNDDYTKISLTETGRYMGVLRAEKFEEVVFEENFDFLVVDKIPGIIESEEDFCGSVTPLRIDYSKSKIISDSLNDSEKKEAVFSNVREAVENSGFNDFVEGNYIASSEWQCPPADAPPDTKCETVREIKRLQSYSPSNTEVLCGESVKGEFSLRGEKFIVGERKSVMRDALQEATSELSSRASQIVCNPDCTKKLDLGIVKAGNTLFGLFGVNYDFAYEISCERLSDVNGFEFNVRIIGEQKCISSSGSGNTPVDNPASNQCEKYSDCENGFYCDSGTCKEFTEDRQCTTDADCVLINKDWEFNCCYTSYCQGRDYSQDNWIAVNNGWYDLGKENHCPDISQCGDAQKCTSIPYFQETHEAKCVENSCQKVLRDSPISSPTF